MNDIDELCCLANSMAMIKSVTFERQYDVACECIVNVLTMIFSPEVDHFGESLLKARFYGVCVFEPADMFGMIFQPCINITDISNRGLENIHYSVSEVEGHFKFMCDRFVFEMTKPADI